MDKRHPTDGELIEGCRAGDERAWRRLVQRYECLVYSTVLRTGLDREAAGDVYQEVWRELHASLARLRDPEAVGKWLMVTSRRRSYRHALLHARQVEGVREDMVDPATLPDAQVEEMETRRLLDEALDGMDEPCATLLRLLFLQPTPASYEEAARATGLAVGSIGPIRARCLRRLKKAWTAVEASDQG